MEPKSVTTGGNTHAVSRAWTTAVGAIQQLLRTRWKLGSSWKGLIGIDLRVSAPPGMLTEELRYSLRANKVR